MAIGTGLSFAVSLYRPIFDRLAVTATLTLVRGAFSIAALDKTVGVSLPQQGGTVVETLTPIAEVMAADLAALGITTDELDDQTITLFPPGVDTSNPANGKTWSIVSHKFNPSPSGIADGTIYLQLEGGFDD